MQTAAVARRVLSATCIGVALVATPLAHAQVVADIRQFADVLNGGITSDEANELRAHAAGYPLEIQFARRLPEGHVFAADVQVTITDGTGTTVLSIESAEPILLARLPSGRYTVQATYEGQTKRQEVVLGRGHQTLGFLW